MNFVPKDGDTFTVLTAASVSGQFDPANVTNLPPGLGLNVDYSSGVDVVLTVLSPPDGDCDGDFAVDDSDYGLFKPCLVGPTLGLDPGCDCADLSDDGNVDLEDVALLQNAFTGSIP